ncbi:MAG: sigma-54-dependent Fis family transcriptional regulator, partial [Deltaproteobacteria bacterium]|nr:sigma-54-dependent Fis family transcriptional regulator [Deltaproteobacteria bacterium]
MDHILVVDDDLSMREFLELMLTREGYEVSLASHGQEALDMVNKKAIDLIISDIRMKHMDGIDVLKRVKAINPEVIVILISAFATAETAVIAMNEGAFDFFPKPFQVDELKEVIKRALAHRTLEAEQKKLKENIQEDCHFGSLVGRSPQMLKVYDLIRRAAQTPTNILITGESGTGKELVARAIHENSPRAQEKFVTINCGGMPEQLIESELFGHKKGAFTGATMTKPGLFEIANKGTIFLDEIGELSVPMQVKLLRVVQEKTYRTVGGTEERRVDVRLISATNKDLETEVLNGRFREDLYYRL